MPKITDQLEMVEVQHILDQHRDYWMRHRTEMRNYTDAYMTRMFSEYVYPNGVTIEIPNAYTYVETLVESTFSKQPSHEVGHGPSGK